MSYLRIGIFAALFAVVAGWMNFYLPSREIVRIVGTEVVRTDVTETDASGNEVTRSRDIQRINAIRPDGSPSVFRNEDTGWGFPFYFKFDTANLAAHADNAVSTAENPKWMVARYYGWRIQMLSTFPNMISLRPASGPDENLFPWFNVIFTTILLIIGLALYRAASILRRRHIDPLIAAVDEELDETVGWWRSLLRRIMGGKR